MQNRGNEKSFEQKNVRWGNVVANDSFGSSVEYELIRKEK